jgi:hypothetical protein
MWKTICARNIKTCDASRVTCNNSSRFARYHGKSVFRFSLLTVFCIIILALSSGCSATYHAYCKDIRHGSEALKSNDYGAARRNFEEAYQNGKSLDALMYLAIIDYKTNNLDSAERLIREAEIMGGGNYHYLRVLGYKALILLKKNRDQGLEALDRYVVFYSRIDPLTSISEVRSMVVSGNIDTVLLNKLIEDQVSWYESDVEQYWSTGTGWYADKWGGLAPIPGPPACNP